MDKQLHKLGEMVIDNKQIFWKTKHVIVLIPILQLFDGHILIVTRKQLSSFTQLNPAQVFDLSLTTKFVARSLESYYGCQSTTIHIQNCKEDCPIKHFMVHVIPRKAGDLKNNNSVYEKLEGYSKNLFIHYSKNMNFCLNVYANKILEGLQEQSKKFEAHLNLCWKEEREI